MASKRKIEFELDKRPGGRIPTTGSGFDFKDKKRYSRKRKHKGGCNERANQSNNED